MSSSDLVLVVNGQRYAGWNSVSVTRAMDAASGAFGVDLFEKWEGQDQPWPIVPQDECAVLLDGEAVITGYVDKFTPSYDQGSHTISIQGRDKTGDLVDCSAMHSPSQWSNITLLAFAKIVAAPFGITVTAEVDTGAPFASIKLQEGESPVEAINRYALQRGLLIMPDGLGGLVITRAGTIKCHDALVQGENIKSAGGSIDSSQRFSVYVAKAQAAYSADSDSEGEAHIEGSIPDPGVKRYRPMVIMAEAGGTDGSAKDRAQWEANTRIGKGTTCNAVVVGWRQSNGDLWVPNRLVHVRSPWLRIDGDMLIRQVTYSKTIEGGTTATLDMVSPQAYSPEPPKPDKADSGANLWSEAIND